jgi:hypothetical protein
MTHFPSLIPSLLYVSINSLIVFFWHDSPRMNWLVILAVFHYKLLSPSMATYVLRMLYVVYSCWVTQL